ncbi:NUDIX domain-containing protein [Sphaerisporangium album]|uniref:NUDIX domain-containing protein n=1 Tax=Sphaerisporangium album TaxID=509200 RepID=A0A367F6C8_9ACTN|nr:NUDIX domain-containing protein [Sphaerisporangium album]RCG25903.1 NUDIX domain-containing protein [Sphaerisporangium album]
MDHQHLHSVSVAGVIIDDQRRALLIQRRDNGHWEAPGGVLELDEDIETGLVREVREETGLEVRPIALTGVYKNMTRGIVALVFRCRAVAGSLAETDESRAFLWATADEVRTLASEAFAVRIVDAMDPTQAPTVRQHDGKHLIDTTRHAAEMSHIVRVSSTTAHGRSDQA